VLVFALLPPSAESVIVFSIAIGATYMATLPATTAVVGNLYGMRHLGVLFGVVMIVHQAGSFLGVWLGGLVIDITGRYDALWAIDAALAIGATFACLAIGDDRARRWRLAPRPARWSLVPRPLGG
jgi:predicted MFS family arabinose efflux permease